MLSVFARSLCWVFSLEAYAELCIWYSYFGLHIVNLILSHSALYRGCNWYEIIHSWCCVHCIEYQIPCRVHTIVFSREIWATQGFLCDSSSCLWFTYHQLECNIWLLRKDKRQAGILLINGVPAGLTWVSWLHTASDFFFINDHVVVHWGSWIVLLFAL